MSDKSSVNTAQLVRAMTIMSIVACILGIASCVSTVKVAGQKVEGVAVGPNGVVFPVVTLDKPYVTDQRLTSFVEECLRKSLSHDYLHYRETMASALSCYTTDGASSYVEAMGPLVDTMKQTRRVMTVVVEKPPVVAKGPYLERGVVTWSVQAEVALGFEGTKDRIPPTRYSVRALVSRMELAENPRGVGISQLGLTPAQVN